MLRRFRKIEVDSRFSAAEDRGQYFVYSKTNVFYLLLSPSRSTSGRLQGKNSLYLQSKRSLRKLNQESRGQVHDSSLNQVSVSPLCSKSGHYPSTGSGLTDIPLLENIYQLLTTKTIHRLRRPRRNRCGGRVLHFQCCKRCPQQLNC